MLVAMSRAASAARMDLATGRLWVARGRRDEGEAGSQRSVVETGIEDGGSQTLGRGAIAMSFGIRSIRPCRRRAAQVVGMRPGVYWLGLCRAAWRGAREHPCGEGSADEEEEEAGIEQGLHTAIGEAQRRGTLVVDSDGLLQVLEGRFADEAVVTDALDVEQTSVGGKPILRSSGDCGCVGRRRSRGCR